jgi:hypothetical protein
LAGDKKVPRKPVIDGEPWHIGGNPDLGDLHDDEQEVVDHTVFQSDDGRWHLWACIRGTKIGRLLYRWEGSSLEQRDWEPKGIAMRVDRSCGESIDEPDGREWIQAPHVIVKDGVHHMLYGAHMTEMGDGQVCLATSPDGRDFTRYKNADGYSRVFQGPAESRDPMAVKIGELYHCYYTGHDVGKPAPCKIYCRTSPDLIEWSDFRDVSWGGSGGRGNWDAECPFVVHLDGYYYLFRTSWYWPPAVTHVYRSEDPLDFGLDDDSKYLGTIRVSAPEVMQVGDQYYISTVEDLQGGVQVAKLKWET